MSLLDDNKKIRDTIAQSLRKEFSEVYTSFVGLSPKGLEPIIAIKTEEQSFSVRSLYPRSYSSELSLTVEAVKREKNKIEDELDELVSKINELVIGNFQILDIADDIRLERVETDFHRESDRVLGGALIKYKILL